jgi:hypothetical protein
MFGRKRQQRLQRENDALRNALEWYASSANWRKQSQRVDGQPRTWIKSPAAFDRGARAKFILTQLAALNVGVHTPEEATADVLARGPGMDTE